MDKTPEVTILKQLMVINLDVNIWSARRKLSAADFQGAKLPPEELASLGSKKICNPDDLRIFSTLKSRAVSMLDRVGVRFLNGWAIPQKKANEVIDNLKAISEDFIAAKKAFLATYDQNILNWINQNLEWQNLIQTSVVSADYVSSRIGFRWQLFQVLPPKKRAIHNNLRDEVAGLGFALYGEISKEADNIWKKCYQGKDQVSQKAISPIRSLHQKLNGLSFVEPNAAHICNLLDTAFQSLPKKGFIKGSSLLMLQGVLSLMRDPNTLIEHGKSLIQGTSPETVLHKLVDTNTTVDTHDETEPDFIPGLQQPQQPIESLGLW